MQTDATEFLKAGLGILCISAPSYLLAYHYGWNFTIPSAGINATVCALLLAIPFAVFTRFYNCLAQQWRRSASDFVASLPNNLCKPEKPLFLGIAGDEISNLPGLIYTLTLFQVQAQIQTEAYLKRQEVKRDSLRPGELRNLLELIFFVIVATAISLWSAVASLLCAFAFKLGFGNDIARHSLFLQVTTEATPPGTWHVTQLNSSIKREGLEVTRTFAHSSYADPLVAKVLGAWILGLSAERDSTKIADYQS